MYCKHCGKEISENSTFCPSCGKPTRDSAGAGYTEMSDRQLLNTYATRVQTNSIIWSVIGILQIIIGFIGICFNFASYIWILVVGILNIISAVKHYNFSKQALSRPVGIIAEEKPLVGPIITLCYNLFFSVIGVIGSVYYLIAIRGFVIKNEERFKNIEDNIISGAESTIF